jgi:hypothetical protein
MKWVIALIIILALLVVVNITATKNGLHIQDGNEVVVFHLGASK